MIKIGSNKQHRDRIKLISDTKMKKLKYKIFIPRGGGNDDPVYAYQKFPFLRGEMKIIYFGLYYFLVEFFCSVESLDIRFAFHLESSNSDFR